MLFSRKIVQLVLVDSVIDSAGEKRVCNIVGQIFFVSVNEFIDKFNFKEDVGLVKIDLVHVYLWDQFAISALDEVAGLNQASATLVDQLAMHNKIDSFEDLVSH